MPLDETKPYICHDIGCHAPSAPSYRSAYVSCMLGMGTQRVVTLIINSMRVTVGATHQMKGELRTSKSALLNVAMHDSPAQIA